MTTKGIIVGALLLIAVVLGILLAFHLLKPTTWDPFYLAFSCAWLAVMAHIFITGPEMRA
jgi:hypothetical protein